MDRDFSRLIELNFTRNLGGRRRRPTCGSQGSLWAPLCPLAGSWAGGDSQHEENNPLSPLVGRHRPDPPRALQHGRKKRFT